MQGLPHEEILIFELQSMAGDAADRRRIDSVVGVGSATWAFRSATFDVGIDRSRIRGRASALLVLECPLFLRTIDLAEVVDTGVFLGGRARFHEVRNGNSGQQ